MDFNSLQYYLEHCFSNEEVVTDAMLKQAKQEWRKIYLSRYHKRYREKYVQISFRIPRKQFQIFKAYAKVNNITVATYIKRLVLDHTQEKTETTGLNTIPLLEAVDLIEEAIQEDTPVDKYYLLSLLERYQ